MGRATNLPWDEILERYMAGEKSRHLATEYGFCQSALFSQLKRRGIPAQNAHSGPGHWNWKGGRYISHGYVKVMHTPGNYLEREKDKSGHVWEHRLEMAKHLGRELEEHETVHHRDGNHSNNPPSNLQLRVGAHGPGVVLCCADCGSERLKALDL